MQEKRASHPQSPSPPYRAAKFTLDAPYFMQWSFGMERQIERPRVIGGSMRTLAP